LQQTPNQTIIIHDLPRLDREHAEKPFSEAFEASDAVCRLLHHGEDANEVLIETIHL